MFGLLHVDVYLRKKYSFVYFFSHFCIDFRED